MLTTADDPAAVTLGADQQRAYDRILAGDNCCLTGPAGTGKSLLVRAVIRGLRQQGRNVAITASTGIAALHVGGTTIHRFLGTGIKGSVDAVRHRRLDDWTLERLGAPDVLVIDEISMLTGDYLDLIDHWTDVARRRAWGQRSEPFGGLQVLLVGDFLQLPPVTPEHEPPPAARFAFQASAWERGRFAVEVLREPFRHADPAFAAQLQAIRVGRLAPDAADFFAPCVGRRQQDPTRLFATNAGARAENAMQLDALPGPASTYQARFWHHLDDLPTRTSAQEHYRATSITQLAEHCIAEPTLTLKPNAPIICLANDPDAGIVNGLRGRVRTCTPHAVEIETETGRTATLYPTDWTQCDAAGTPTARMTQIPCKLAWALTIHKAQGLTLSTLECGLGRVFAGGHTYVALSRVRTREGLGLRTPLTPAHVAADPQCLAFYRTVAPDLS